MAAGKTSPPGFPGISPRWTSSAKIGVGTAMSSSNNVWFTISHGIINEVYFPRLDVANTRDIGLLITDGDSFFSEEKRDAEHDYELIEEGIPAYVITNTCLDKRYQIKKLVYCDPQKNVLLQEIEFIPLVGKLEDYHVYALIAPHILNAGWHNTCYAGEFKGHPVLFAKGEQTTLCLAFTADVPFINMSCGYVGYSDAWQDINKNKQMTHFYHEARDGNVAMCGEIDLKACGGKFMLALGFGIRYEAAGFQVRSSILRNKDEILNEYLHQWRQEQKPCQELVCIYNKNASRLYRMSTMVLKVHAGKHFNGSLIASLSIPWGFEKGDNDLGGYHLIWPRDQVMTAYAFMAANDFATARNVLHFLMTTQEVQGYWAQCMWEDGSVYWTGMQLDETALPILLAYHLKVQNQLACIDPRSMVARAASYIVKNGPITGQDRWEETSGYTPATIAAEITALLAASEFLEEEGKKQEAKYLLEVADWWNESIERWLYVKDTDLAKKLNIEGYYVRVCPCHHHKDKIPEDKMILIVNRPEGDNFFPYTDIVSVDALALVRFGLRAADDPRMLNTIKVIDHLLKTETERGPVWHRYNEDGYGEKADGSPFDGLGVGRGWPLLTGERAHYEIANGKVEEAIRLCDVMSQFAGVGGLFPEQVWDTDDIPEKRLYKGHSTGSAKPLVWAHAEYITLLRSIRDKKVFAQNEITRERYLGKRPQAAYAMWAWHQRLEVMPKGKKLRIQVNKPALVHWSMDEWKTFHDSDATTNELGIYYIDIPSEKLKEGSRIDFTFFWKEGHRWEGHDMVVKVGNP
jgi:glucoamylase